MVDRVLRLWGKTGGNEAEPGAFHPVVYHMLDAGNVAEALLTSGGSRRWCAVLRRTLSACDETLAQWVPYVVALHDIGKVSAGFQTQHAGQAARLRLEGFDLHGTTLPHQVISEAHVGQPFEVANDWGIIWRSAVQQALGGHHGRFNHPDDLRQASLELVHEPAEWRQMRESAAVVVYREFVDARAGGTPEPTNISAAVMALTGFIILCDWLSSDQRIFSPLKNADWPGYAEQSRQRAQQCVNISGLGRPTVSPAATPVRLLFSDLRDSIRPLQAAVDEIPAGLLRGPSLTIIEAPTGEGKTEAALALAHRIATMSGTDEFYCALPTMATSNQMFGRLRKHIVERLRLASDVKLVHGQAHLMEAELRRETPPASIEPLDGGTDSDSADISEWFNSKKRALMAPFGVGTIDQAELAALNVKHVPLRMMGLAGKVLIVDEVHAYDVYMTTVVKRLLQWCATMGTSVILLSATLPVSRRRELADAYEAGRDWVAVSGAAYPSLLVVGGGHKPHQAVPAAWQPNRTICLGHLQMGDDEYEHKARWLLDAVSSGGCACWITNTVPRAQDIFRRLEELAPRDVELALVHSQFPLDVRRRREHELCSKYGPDGSHRPPTGGIVVGTQVLEQSLDLDFDVMVTDLAPVDLLLQRSGRLHRHERERPPAHAEARLYINWQRTTEGELRLGSDRRIYAEYTMRRTLKALSAPVICLPHDYRELVEAVYGGPAPAHGDPDRKAWDELDADRTDARKEASDRLVPRPRERESFATIASTRIKFEEDENRADWVVAQTRRSGDSLEIIPLEREGNWAWVPGSPNRFDVRRPLSKEAQVCLLRQSLRISRPASIAAIKKAHKLNPVRAFTSSTHLKRHHPLWLSGGEAELEFPDGAVKFRLSPDLGLEISGGYRKEEGDRDRI